MQRHKFASLIHSSRVLSISLLLIILGGPVAQRAAVQPVSFGAKTNFGTGNVPVSVAVGDFNGDGRLDLAVANILSDTVSILLGTGAGSFGAKTDFATGHWPNSVGVADFNGDGTLDLAVVNQLDHTVSILLGTGTGSFDEKTDFGTGSHPVSVVVGDFNVDGTLDLATANANGDTVSILLGTGTGSFGAKTDFGTGTGSSPHAVAVGDFNGDGTLDLATANYGSNTGSILLGTGTGSFGTKTDFGTGTSPFSVAVGDFNGDGNLDLAVANNNASGTVSILLGTGTGSFGAKTDFDTGNSPDSVAVSDFNGDGKLDLAVANFSAASVSILLGTGTGSFGAKTDFGTDSFPELVAVGDFNRDGKLDLATANYSSNTVSILLNSTPIVSSGVFCPKTDFGTGNSPITVAVGDFNGDGTLDLAVPNFDKIFGNSVSILLGTGTGSFGAKTDFGTGRSPFSVAVGDFNGDGTLDLATANRFSNTVSILLGTGTGSFGANTDFGTGSFPVAVAVGDFNGDGTLDLAVTNENSNTVSILLGTGTGSLGAKTDFGTGDFPFSVAVGDFNGDGKLDLAVANLGSSTVSILLGTGTGSFGAKTDFATGNNPRAIAVGDFNRDGRLDLATANFSSNSVSILLGTGTGSFGANTDFATGSLPTSVAVGDFNRDGTLDLAVATRTSNAVSILLGTGTGSFGAKTDFGTGDFPFSVAVGDFNGDGKLDLAVANANSINPSTVSILLNNTPPSISADPVSRAAGTPSANSQIALVDDAQDTPNTLSVTVNGGTSATVNGVTVTLNPTAPDASGQVFADVVADCTATTATFTLRVTDGCGLFTETPLTVTVNPPPPPMISPTSQLFTSSGGTDTVNVTSPDCPWTAVSNDPSFITITTGSSGSGNGAVNYSVGANTGPARMGTMTIAGLTFTVTQDYGCTFTPDRDHESFAGNGGNSLVNLTASDPGCAWAASTTATFIHVTSGSAGTGNGSVQYSVDANPGATIRSETITIGGHTFTVYQGINFLDVPANDVFYTVIGQLSARGVTLGCGDGNYCSNDPVTREQMAAFIMRAKGEFNPPTPGSQRFVDVPPANVFYNFIDRLAELQITLGCSPTMYCPSDAVKREQMAAFIIRGLGEFNPPIPGSQRFVDVPPANPFYKFIDRMAVLQITLGCSPTMYCPNDTVTRGQMAAFLVRAFNL